MSVWGCVCVCVCGYIIVVKFPVVWIDLYIGKDISVEAEFF